MAPALSLKIRDEEWQKIDGDDLLLGPVLSINGTPMHLEAWAVCMVDGVQTTVSERRDEDFGHIHYAVAGDGPFETTTIRGREYVLIATPHC